jgi:hypothetical protein
MSDYCDPCCGGGVPVSANVPGPQGLEGQPGVTGPTGSPPALSIGTVTGGVTAAVTLTGSDEAPILNFVLPAGPTGPEGPMLTLIRGHVATSAALIEDNTVGDAWFVDNTARLGTVLPSTWVALAGRYRHHGQQGRTGRAGGHRAGGRADRSAGAARVSRVPGVSWGGGGKRQQRE